ncbi:hypothetical protein [Micromonospora sp. CPCC 206061]|uniref:hypothetical protein n=1 Tax=Micromonospora sp. CPCC 206061 TaxID=3122410 RepID=UPI002FF0736C
MATLTIWEKVDASVLDRLPSRSSGEEAGQPRRKINWKRRFRIANGTAIVLWSLAITKLALFDIDRFLLNRLAPSWSFVADYRFFVILAALALFLAIAQKNILWLVYFAVFPLVVLFWYFPRFLYRCKSWTLVLVVANLGFSFFHRFRRNFLIRTVEIVVVLAIILSTNSLIFVIAAALLFVALLFHYVRGVKSAIAPSKFLKSQKEFIAKKFQTPGLLSTVGIKPELRSNAITKFDKAQLEQFIQSVSAGLMTVKIADFYVFLLDRYRRTSASILIALASFVWLFMQSVIGLTLINYAIWKADNFQFSYEGKPSLLHFIYASLLSLYGNEASVVAPSGEWAVAVSAFASFYGPLLLIALGAHLWFGFKQSRDETAFKETVKEIRVRRKELQEHLESEYEVPLDEVVERLASAGLSAGGVFVYLATHFPEPPDEE